MRIFVGLLAIFTIAFVFSTAFAVPRYSASVPQADDSPVTQPAIESANTVIVPQVDSNMSTEDRSKQNSIAQAIQNAKDMVALDKKWELDPLSRPKYNLIPASDIGKYRYTERYLELGDTQVSHYFILQEDYVFRNLDGRFDKIPAGFIWDGASIPKVKGAIALEVGNTRYNSALAEGLIHDYMYRNPHRYPKKEADELFYDNLKRCNNPDSLIMYKAVELKGGEAYRRHQNNQQQGYYDVFTPEFYAENLKIFQDGNMTSNSIDTSKLESLLKEGISFLKNLIAKGERATNSQIATHNQRVKEMIEELVKIAKQIESMNVSAEEKKRIGEKVHEKVDRLQSQFDSLCERAKSMGLVQEATTEQKREVFKDMQGKQTEVSRDAEKAKESSAKASASSQGRTMTEEDVFRMLREEGSGIKAASGRPNSTLR